MDFTLVFSTQNELSKTFSKKSLEELVRTWATMARSINGSLLVADAGSTDGTLETLKSLEKEGIRIVSSRSSRRARVIRVAYDQLVNGAFGGYVCHVDASLRLPPDLFLKVWELRHKAPFLVGKRMKRQDAFHEIILTKIQSLWCKVLFWRISSDPNLGFRLYQTSFLKPLLEIMPSWAYTTDLVLCLYAFQSRVRILEVPIVLKDKPIYRPLAFRHVVDSVLRFFEILLIRLTLGVRRYALRMLRSRF